MKRNKPTYITDLTTEILTNRDLLHQWAENSVDMEFLELSTEILSNIDLLDRWDCDNILNIKLASILSGNQNYKLKSGIEIIVDQSTVILPNASIYKKIIKRMKSALATSELIRKDMLQEGYSLEEIEKQERYIKASLNLSLYEQTKNYSISDLRHYFLKSIPEIINENKKLEKNFFARKIHEMFNLSTEKKAFKLDFNDAREGKPFKIGLKFATGEVQDLYENLKNGKGHFLKICLELDFKKTDRPYFSETINKNKSAKNIYLNKKVMLLIKEHCVKNDITMCSSFLEEIEEIERKQT
jgi:hypothetical protein